MMPMGILAYIKYVTKYFSLSLPTTDSYFSASLLCLYVHQFLFSGFSASPYYSHHSIQL